MITIIIIIFIYFVGVAISTILDAKLTKDDINRYEYDKYFSILSWIGVFIGFLFYFIDYIYNKFHK